MTSTEIAQVGVGTVVTYQDMANAPRTGMVVDIDDTPWGRMYGVAMGDTYTDADGIVREEIKVTDLRQRGWTVGE
jgi:hypothetical protein